jgi:hypothetical protein
VADATAACGAHYTHGARGESRPDGVCVFITAVPNTKLCAWGEEDS